MALHLPCLNWMLISRALVLTSLFSCSYYADAQATSVSTRIQQAVDEKHLVSLLGNVHPLARPEFDQGPVADSQPLMRMLLLLQRDPAQEADLAQLLSEQQDRSSPNYHSWLTPQEFGQRFGLADADLQVVTQWLAAHGFTGIRVANSRTVIEFSGNVGSVRSAFRTQIHQYLVGGAEHVANDSDPQIPAALQAVVAGIVSLHNFYKKPMHHLAGASAGLQATGPTPASGPAFTFSCFDYITGLTTPCHPVGPYDFATIYNLLPLWNAASPIDGTGQTIAIVGRTNINVQDAADFRNIFGMPPNPPQVIVDGADPGLVPGDETEADLDVEWSGAVAKNATIKLVASQSTQTTDGVDLSALYIVDNNLASVMSESYGQCEFNMGAAGNQFYSNLWQQAAAQGITVLVSSGDNGSAGCDFELNQGLFEPAQFGLQVNGIASSPYDVAVGGTDFNDYFNSANYWNATSDPITQQSVKAYVPETTWNDSCTNAVLQNPIFSLSTNPETNCNKSEYRSVYFVSRRRRGKEQPSQKDACGEGRSLNRSLRIWILRQESSWPTPRNPRAEQ
jgi:subtilase family serine protease